MTIPKNVSRIHPSDPNLTPCPDFPGSVAIRPLVATPFMAPTSGALIVPAGLGASLSGLWMRSSPTYLRTTTVCSWRFDYSPASGWPSRSSSAIGPFANETSQPDAHG
jgi:hypothetical protein